MARFFGLATSKETVRPGLYEPDMSSSSRRAHSSARCSQHQALLRFQPEPRMHLASDAESASKPKASSILQGFGGPEGASPLGAAPRPSRPCSGPGHAPPPSGLGLLVSHAAGQVPVRGLEDPAGDAIGAHRLPLYALLLSTLPVELHSATLQPLSRLAERSQTFWAICQPPVPDSDRTRAGMSP